MSDTTTFVPALLELRHASMDTVIERIHKLFTHIGVMSAQEVIASFQTLEALALDYPDLQKSSVLVCLLEAMRIRMVGINQTTRGLEYGRSFEAVLKNQVSGFWITDSIRKFRCR